MMLYKKFRNSSLDISPVGLYTGSAKSNLAQTPINAKIIAWSAHRNGLHFCHIPGLDNLVFAVDLTAPPGESIHPVANNLLDFIGLICRCGDVSLIADAYQWSSLYFEIKRTNQKISLKTSRVLKALENIYRPPFIKDAYRYIRELQTSFDYSRIPLDARFFKVSPLRPGASKWCVSFDAGFYDISEKNTETKKLTIDRQFQWQNERWCVPAIYLTEKGIIVDSYMEASKDKILTYMKTWENRNDDRLSTDEAIAKQHGNPLSFPAASTLLVNNKSVSSRNSHEIVWNPYTDNSWNVRKTLEYYDLDKNMGYIIRRDCFPYKKHFNTIRTIEFMLSAEPISVPSEHFTVPDAGQRISFTHPQTNIQHELTVISQSNEALEPNFLSNHPCCYTKMLYTLTPPIHKDLFKVVDADPGDPWYGESDEPTSLFYKINSPTGGYCAVSSLRYEPDKKINWQMIFKQKPCQDMLVRLIP